MSYATLSWSPEDVLTLAPRLTLEQAEAWLSANEGNLRDRLTERGWDVMSTLLAMGGIDTSDPDPEPDEDTAPDEEAP